MPATRATFWKSSDFPPTKGSPVEPTLLEEIIAGFAETGQQDRADAVTSALTALRYLNLWRPAGWKPPTEEQPHTFEKVVRLMALALEATEERLSAPFRVAVAATLRALLAAAASTEKD